MSLYNTNYKGHNFRVTKLSIDHQLIEAILIGMFVDYTEQPRY